MKRGLLATQNELSGLHDRLGRKPFGHIYETLRKRCALILESLPITETMWRTAYQHGQWGAATAAVASTQGRIFDLLICHGIDKNAAYRDRAIKELKNLVSFSTWVDPSHADQDADYHAHPNYHVHTDHHAHADKSALRPGRRERPRRVRPRKAETQNAKALQRRGRRQAWRSGAKKRWEMTIEEVRRFWDRRPCNVRHSQRNINKNPLAYSLEVTRRKLLVEPHLVTFAQFGQWAGKRVLDAGCGIGTQAILFAKAGAKVTAIDISPRSLKIAATRAIAEGVAQDIDFYLADLENLNKIGDDAPFDLIYSWGVLHHTPAPMRAMRQLRRFANDHTIFKVMLYHKWSWKMLWAILTHGKVKFWQASNIIREYSEAQSGSPISRTYSKQEARKLLRRAGLTITSIAIDHIFPYRIADYIEHRLIKEWYWAAMPSKVFRFLEKRVGWHLMINAKLETRKPEKG